MKILVIGANGYIGNVIAERILSEGWSVIGSTRSEAASVRLREQGIEPYLGDLEKPETILPIIPQIDAVVYSAYGYNAVEDAEREISSGKSHITWLLEAMYATDKTFVLTSGSGVYPDTGDIICTEETPMPPSKSSITIARRNLEIEVQAAAKHGVRTIVLRPPTVYGRGGSLLVPRFLLDHARSQGESIYIEGTENKKWSTVHVDDLADLFILALHKARAGSFYNTASESGITTRDIASSISRAADLGGKVKAISLEQMCSLFGNWGEWWGINNQLSGEKAMMELGWKPHQVSMLEDIEHGSYKGQLEAKPIRN